MIREKHGARDYDSVIGRWLERDPILFNGGSSNLYSYAHNDPVNFVDPSGLQIGQKSYTGDGGGGINYYHLTSTAGDSVDDQTDEAMQCFGKCVGSPVVVTGAREGGHSPGSAHESGQACDVGKNSNPNLSRETAQECFNQCFNQSTSYGQEENNHFHFQTRPGKGGATGGFPDGIK